MNKKPDITLKICVINIIFIFGMLIIIALFSILFLIFIILLFLFSFKTPFNFLFFSYSSIILFWAGDKGRGRQLQQWCITVFHRILNITIANMHIGLTIFSDRAMYMAFNFKKPIFLRSLKLHHEQRFHLFC